LDPIDLALSFSAGVLSLLSPCGYLLLPGYISYYLGSDVSRRRAILGGILCAIGLITVLLGIGALTSVLGSLIFEAAPKMTLIAGIAIVFFGVSILFELRPISIPVSLKMKIPEKKGSSKLVLFWVAYGIASFGCSAPIFMSMVIYAATKGPLDGLLIFLSYVVGIGLPLILTGILVAEARTLTIKKIKKATPYLQKFSGILMLSIGLFLTFSSIH